MSQFKQQNLDLLPGQSGYHGAAKDASDRLDGAKAALNEAITSRDVLAAEFAAIPAQLEEHIATTLGGVGFGPPTDTAVRMLEVEAEIQRLLGVYTEQHPDVVALHRRLDGLREQFENENALPDDMDESDTGPATTVSLIINPLHGQVKLQLIQQESTVQILRERAPTTPTPRLGHDRTAPRPRSTRAITSRDVLAAEFAAIPAQLEEHIATTLGGVGFGPPTDTAVRMLEVEAEIQRFARRLHRTASGCGCLASPSRRPARAVRERERAAR